MELKIGERGEKILQLLMLGILMLSMFVISKEGALFIHTSSTQVVAEKKKVIVIDAGHGGIDPGKIGIHGEQEKGINLKIAEFLKTFLELDGYEVVMTRTEDGGLYDENTSNKKVQDMKRRIEVIEEADPILVVSIHQNSYPDPAIKGAQVFYYTSSVEGKQLAKRLQERLVKGLDPQNHRQAKANDSYYLLKKTACPIVIVECGFLSNPQEEALLTDCVYQERVAWNIFMGIMQELKTKKA
mgnify:CR=1 FL=1